MELLPANMGGGDSMPTAGGPTLPNEFATVDAVQKASTTSSSSSSNNATTATTKTNQGNTVDDEEEESNVLASVHASLHEQTAYEGRVLREASLHGMPSLVLLPTLLKSVGGGKFPDAPVLLASLLPTDDATDNAFGKKQQGTNRKRQTPSNNNNLAARLDRSRVHQLRTMLQAIRIQLQQEDSQSLLDNNNSMALSSSLLSDVTTTSSNVLRMKEQILSHILSSLPPSMVSSLLDDVDATNSKCETERGSHTQKPRVTWQEPEPATGRSEAATGTVPRRRRVPIMHRRQQQPYELDGDAAGVASTPAPHDKEIKRHEPERISNLRRARVERTRRKDNRRRQINPSQSFGDDNHGHCSEEKEEREMDSAATESLSTIATIRMDGSVVAQSQGDGTASKIAPANDSSIVVVSSSLNNDVICPECHARLTVDESSDGDAILAHHMMSEFCGDGSRKSRRLQQQRKQQAPVQTPVSTLRPTRNSNAVVDESDDDDDGDETFMDIFQADEDDDESVLPMRQPRSGTAKQATERSGTSINDTRTSVIRPPTNSVTIDDFNEWDYEDRVDDWILNGLDRMKIMRERDGKEELPGALEHDGGLLIPAWINDRLFGYQREGLEWMWDLHQRKQAGGIIGDEMGLVRTSLLTVAHI